jgi:hypothetical protein
VSDDEPREPRPGPHNKPDQQQPPAEPDQPDQPAQDGADEPNAPDAPVPEAASDPRSLVKKRNRGDSRERLEYERQALSSFNRAKATAENIAGRDLHLHHYHGDGPRGTTQVSRLSDEVIEEIRRTFVIPQGLPPAQELTDRTLVILQGAQDTGRYAAARWLLSGCDQVFGVHPETPLTELEAERLTAGAGYIRLDLTRAEARALTEFQIGELIATLRKRDARMVVTAGPAVSFKEGVLAELVIRPGQVTDRMDILQRQLAWRLGEEITDALLDDPEVQRLAVHELDGAGPPLHARTVAVELVKAHRADLPPARTAAGVLNQAEGQRLRQWFKALPTLSVQCMALAVAVLGGEPYEVVADAAEALRRRLAPPRKAEQSEEDADRPLADSKEEWLEHLGARLAPGTVRTRHGAQVPAETIRFLDDSAQARVLVYFFRSFDRHRPALLDWLRWCAAGDLESVRIRTAVATGVLTGGAYDLVRTSVILPWANSADPRLRDAAAIALGVTANEDGLREAATRTVAGWAEEDDKRLRATAARAWRVHYDGDGVDAALELLKELAEDDDLVVADAICDTITELWEEVGDGFRAPALLLEWIADDDEQRRLTARLAFLVATVDLVREPPGDAEPVEWPRLLHIAASDPTRQRELGALWRDALASGGLGPTAKEILSDWARTAEPHPAMRHALTRLLMAAASDRTAHIRIRNEAAKWAKEAPRCSREVLDALARKGDR